MIHRALLFSLLTMYLGFMIGWIERDNYNKYIDKFQPITWQFNWKKSQFYQGKIFLNLDGVWSKNDDNVATQIYLVDGPKEYLVCFIVVQSPHYELEITNWIKTIPEPSQNAKLMLRNINGGVTNYDLVGFSNYEVIFK